MIMSRCAMSYGFTGLAGCLLVSSVSAQVDPYAAYPLYGESAAGGYLRGAASVITAQGQFLKDVKQSKLMEEEVRRSKVDTRRKQLEQWLWERENLPTPQEERERRDKEFLRHSRFSATDTEIWSGVPLNLLLQDARKIQSAASQVNSPPLDEKILAKLSFTTGKQDADIGVIKSGKVFWPLVMRREQFKDDRQEADQLIKQAVRDAAQGRMDAESVEQLARKVEDLEAKLKGVVRKMPEGDTWTGSLYREGMRFLAQLKAAVRTLTQPDAADYFNGKYDPQGKTVADLIQNMSKLGVKFAPAKQGNESAYTAFYHLLVDYDSTGGSQFKTKEKP
jgi:hypothetical protein